jgi:hypothetical protein
MVITTVVKTRRKYRDSNPKQLTDSILLWEESQLADIYHSSTPAPPYLILYIIKNYFILLYKDNGGGRSYSNKRSNAFNTILRLRTVSV